MELKFDEYGNVILPRLNKGRKAAVAHFSKLCREVLAFNAKVRRDKAADLEAARRGDIGAALRLGDY